MCYYFGVVASQIIVVLDWRGLTFGMVALLWGVVQTKDTWYGWEGMIYWKEEKIIKKIRTIRILSSQTKISKIRLGSNKF